MNCTQHEFKNKVKTAYPSNEFYLLFDPNGTFVFAHSCDYKVFANYDLTAKLSGSDFVWFDGRVIKDTDGLFAAPAGQLFTPVGPYTYTLPNNPYYTYTFKIAGGGGAGSGKSSAKCECGAHSVGSNRHSSYCPLDKENS